MKKWLVVNGVGDYRRVEQINRRTTPAIASSGCLNAYKCLRICKLICSTVGRLSEGERDKQRGLGWKSKVSSLELIRETQSESAATPYACWLEW